MNKTLQLPEPAVQRNPNPVISNDWVPTTQISKMHKAEPIQRAGLLRLQWYRALAKNVFSKFVFFSRSTA